MQTLIRSWALYQLFSPDSGRYWTNIAIPATSGAMRAPLVVPAGGVIRVELTPHRPVPASGTVYCFFQGMQEIGGVRTWRLYSAKVEVEGGSLERQTADVTITMDGLFWNETVAFSLLARSKWS